MERQKSGDVARSGSSDRMVRRQSSKERLTSHTSSSERLPRKNSSGDKVMPRKTGSNDQIKRKLSNERMQRKESSERLARRTSSKDRLMEMQELNKTPAADAETVNEDVATTPVPDAELEPVEGVQPKELNEFRHLGPEIVGTVVHAKNLWKLRSHSKVDLVKSKELQKSHETLNSYLCASAVERIKQEDEEEFQHATLKRDQSSCNTAWAALKYQKLEKEWEAAAEYLTPVALEKLKEKDKQELQAKLLKRQSKSSVKAWAILKRREDQEIYEKCESYYTPAAMEKIKAADAVEEKKTIQMKSQASFKRSTSRFAKSMFNFSAGKEVDAMVRYGSYH